jgi:hypothetical protein
VPSHGRGEHRPHAPADQFLPGRVKSAGRRLKNLPPRSAVATAEFLPSHYLQRKIKQLCPIVAFGPVLASGGADIEQERLMTANQIALTTSVGAPDRGTPPVGPDDRGGDARALFLALLGGAAGPLTMARPTGIPAAGGQSADALLRLIDRATAEKPQEPAEPQPRAEAADVDRGRVADETPPVATTERRRGGEEPEGADDTDPLASGDGQPGDEDADDTAEQAPAAVTTVEAGTETATAAATGGGAVVANTVTLGSSSPGLIPQRRRRRMRNPWIRRRTVPPPARFG